MKKNCKSLRELATKIINFKKNKKTLLRNEQLKSYENRKIWYICKQKFEDKHVEDKWMRIIENIEVLHISNVT